MCVIVLATTAIFDQTGEKVARIEAATSGLKIGDPFSPDVTDAAAERLVNSHLFKKLAIARSKSSDFDSESGV